MTNENKWKYTLYGVCFALAIVTTVVQLSSKEPSGAAIFWAYVSMCWATFTISKE